MTKAAALHGHFAFHGRRTRHAPLVVDCFVAFLSACVGSRAITPPTMLVDLERRGEGYPVYRIPALTVTNKGTWIAAYDGRPTMADVPSNIALLVRRSTDGGATWLQRQVVRADSAPFGFGDPSLLVDRKTGRIFRFHAASILQGFARSAVGNDENNPNVLQADYSWSEDDRVRWQHRRITSAIKKPAWGGIFAASIEGIQLRYGAYAGRLIQQYVIRHGTSNFAVSAFSDDHGATWSMGEPVGPGADENKVVELGDGRMMLADLDRSSALTTELTHPMDVVG